MRRAFITPSMVTTFRRWFCHAIASPPPVRSAGHRHLEHSIQPPSKQAVEHHPSNRLHHTSNPAPNLFFSGSPPSLVHILNTNTTMTYEGVGRRKMVSSVRRLAKSREAAQPHPPAPMGVLGTAMEEE
nr:unnamed protein product [Digitaria exilis]